MWIKRWAARLWALRVLWSAALLLLLVDLALQTDDARPSSLAAMSAQAARPQPAEILLLGSSRLRVIDAARVATAAAARGGVNVAFNGGGGIAMRWLAARHLTPEVLKAGETRLLIIGLGALDLNDGAPNPIIAEGWGVADLLGHVLEHGTDRLTRKFFFDLAPLRRSGLLSSVRNGKLRGRVRAVGLRWMSTLGLAAPPPPPRRSAAEEDVLNNATARHAQGAAVIQDVAPPLSSSYLHNLAMGGPQRAALLALVQRLKADGVAVALVHLPVSDWYAHVYDPALRALYLKTLRGLAEAADAPLFLLKKTTCGLSDADYFRADGRFDGHHIISKAGRARFADALGARVAGPILRRLDRGEPVGFAHSVIEEVLP
ncbi:hypothetical protein KKF91_00920 [Myxococcota bacterium]|nr:hypothetical protein [Myxococcota bacterium]MBU1429096.1 hypothetical protein [Myxococcota bacterium]MBU1899962.1 hypothetical protein [Myxococcota bacterium]